MASANSGPVSNHPDAWKKVSDREWRRRLFGMESYFVLVGNMTAEAADGREHYTICTAVKLTNSIDVEHLKKAWTRLRFQQPKIAAWTDASDWTMHYTVPQESDLKTWLEDTLAVIEGISYSDFYSEFKAIKTATLYWLPQSNELVFRCPHWQCDGIGSWLFWDAFFTNLECVLSSDNTKDLSWGEEVARLSPTMKEIWNITDLEPKFREQGQEILKNWVENIPGLGPDPIRKTPGKCQKLELEFDHQTTSSLLKAIKKEGISVTVAFHAAFAIANADVANRANVKSNYATTTNINLRRYLGPPYTSSDHAVNVYYSAIPLVLPVGTFDEMIDGMNKFYKQSYDEPGKLQMVCSFLESAFETVQSPEFASAPVPGDAGLSSLGVAERYFKTAYADGSVEIVDMHNSADIVLGMSLAFLYTFSGKMRFTYCYNEGLQDRSVVEKIVVSTKEILLKQYGI